MNGWKTNGYDFHPGIVKGVFQVRNIVESDDLAPFQRSWTKTTGYYIDENDGLAVKIPPNKVLDLDLGARLFRCRRANRRHHPGRRGG